MRVQQEILLQAACFISLLHPTFAISIRGMFRRAKTQNPVRLPSMHSCTLHRHPSKFAAVWFSVLDIELSMPSLFYLLLSPSLARVWTGTKSSRRHARLACRRSWSMRRPTSASISPWRMPATRIAKPSARAWLLAPPASFAACKTGQLPLAKHLVSLPFALSTICSGF